MLSSLPYQANTFGDAEAIFPENTLVPVPMTLDRNGGFLHGCQNKKTDTRKVETTNAQLPPIFNEFLQAKTQKKLSLASRYEYAKDFHLFTDYLRKRINKK